MELENIELEKYFNGARVSLQDGDDRIYVKEVDFERLLKFKEDLNIAITKIKRSGAGITIYFIQNEINHYISEANISIKIKRKVISNTAVLTFTFENETTKIEQEKLYSRDYATPQKFKEYHNIGNVIDDFRETLELLE